MKKTKFLRIASALLMLCLITTCAVGGTFAKYTTGAQNSDTARVAKWGVTTSVTIPSTDNLNAEYASNESPAMVTLAVQANNADNMLAPGTAGKIINADIKGTPEVAARITVTVDLELVGWNITSGEYCPVVFTVNGVDYKIDTKTVADFELAVEDAIINALKTADAKNIVKSTDGTASVCVSDYEPNMTLDTAVAISWSWAFDAAGYQTDEKDTALGDLSTAPTMSISIVTLIEQID